MPRSPPLAGVHTGQVPSVVSVPVHSSPTAMPATVEKVAVPVMVRRSANNELEPNTRSSTTGKMRHTLRSAWFWCIWHSLPNLTQRLKRDSLWTFQAQRRADVGRVALRQPHDLLLMTERLTCEPRSPYHHFRNAHESQERYSDFLRRSICTY